MIHVMRLAILAVGLAVAASTQAAEYEFNLANVSGANTLAGMADQKFAELVKEKTNGRIEITPQPGGALGFKDRDQFNAVMDGAVAIANTPFDKLVGIAPIYQLQSIPFLNPTLEQAKALYEIARPYYEEALNEANQTLLFVTPYTPQGIWAKKRIESPADLQGLKIRTYDVAGTETFKAAGASPVQIGFADVPTALGTGTIEAVLTSDESGVSARFWDQGVKYFNFLGYTVGIGAVTMNKEAFDSLPPELQQAIQEAAAEAGAWAWEGATQRVEENKEKMAVAGAVFVADTPAAVVDHLKQASSEILGKWKAEMGPEAETILSEYEKAAGT